MTPWTLGLKSSRIVPGLSWVVLASLAAAPAWSADGGIADGGPIADAGTPATDAGSPPVDAGPGPDDAGAPPPVDAGGEPTDAGPPDEPAVWTCEPSYYDANDGCDCECGIPDPDCALANPANPTVYGCPAGVGCSLDGFCEIPGCGDGALNPDFELCDDGNNDVGDGCSPSCRPESGWSCTADPLNCIPVPSNWQSAIGPYCSDGRYGDGAFCDCGCGALDADCDSATSECTGLPLGCIPTSAVDEDGQLVWSAITLVPDLEDNTRCVGNVCGDTWVAGPEECDDGNTTPGDLCDGQCVIETPEGWNCPPIYVLDDECDCGCGAPDPACPGVALDPVADCAFDECRGPANVDPTDHSQCLEPDPVVDAGPGDGDGDGDGDSDAGAGEPDPPTNCSASHPATGRPLAGLAFAAMILGALARRRRL